MTGLEQTDIRIYYGHRVSDDVECFAILSVPENGTGSHELLMDFEEVERLVRAAHDWISIIETRKRRAEAKP